MKIYTRFFPYLEDDNSHANLVFGLVDIKDTRLCDKSSGDATIPLHNQLRFSNIRGYTGEVPEMTSGKIWQNNRGGYDNESYYVMVELNKKEWDIFCARHGI